MNLNPDPSSKNQKSYVHWFGNFFKVMVTLIIIYFLYNRLFVKNDFKTLWLAFQDEFSFKNIWFLGLTILLMPVNWFLESEKWRTLMLHFTELSRIDAFKAIFAGVSFGIITPNRIGEYGGRVIAVEKDQNWNTVFTTFLCSIAQNIISLFFGGIALYFFLFQEKGDSYGVFAFVFVLFLAMIFVLFYSKRFWLKISEIKILQKRIWIVSSLKSIAEIPKMSLSKTLLLSFLRYLVYLFQYVFVLIFFEVPLALSQMLEGISSIFLIQTGLPLPPLMNVVARGEIALNILGTYGINEITILLATFFIWILNLVVPALLGLIVVLKTNIMQSLGLNN